MRLISTTNTSRQGNALRRLLPTATLALLVTGCATAPPTSLDAFCDETRQLRAEVAALLGDTQDEALLQAGAKYVEAGDAACAK